MSIYLCIILFIFISFKKINKEKMTLNDYLLLAILIVICGFRNNVGTDYKLYINMYKYLDWFPKLEIIVKLIIIVLRYFDFAYTSFFVVMSFLTFSILYKAIKEQSIAPAESILYYICFGYFAMACYGMRQMLAISRCIYSLKYIKNRNPIRYYLVNIISILCHTTSIVMLPMYLICNKKIKKSILEIVSFLSMFSFVLYNPIYSFVVTNFSRFSDYAVINSMTYCKAGPGTFVIGFIHFVLIFIVIKYYDRIVKENEKNLVHLNLIMFSTMFFSLSFVNTVVVRMAYYFSVNYIFILPFIFKYITMGNNKNIYYIFIIGIIISYFIIHLISFNQMIPYNWIFS